MSRARRGRGRCRRGSPNILFIVLDTGFGQLGCYGGPIAGGQNSLRRPDRRKRTTHFLRNELVL
jgi:arylsulfatase A-like enzyme